MEPADLVGMPRIIEDATHFVPPAALPRAGRGLLVIEELNRAPRYMQAPCLQLLTDRRLNDYRLPDGWLPCAAINPAEQGYQSSELDPALLSRFSQIEVCADRDEWLEWAVKNDLHVSVTDFVRGNPEIFSDKNPVSNPRAWSYVSDVVNAFELGEGAAKDSLYAAVEGLLDSTWATAFFRYYRGMSDKPLTAAEIVHNFQSNISMLKDWKARKKVDLLRSSWVALKNYLQKQENYDELIGQADQRKNVDGFLKTIPKDIKQEAISWLYDRGYEELCE
jgi:hypothetical protein